MADFKTTARPPKPGQPPPRSYVAQLALYRMLLAEIYPGKRIRTFLIWTSGPVIHELHGTGPGIGTYPHQSGVRAGALA